MKRCNLLLMLILLGASVLLQTACKPLICAVEPLMEQV